MPDIISDNHLFEERGRKVSVVRSDTLMISSVFILPGYTAQRVLREHVNGQNASRESFTTVSLI